MTERIRRLGQILVMVEAGWDDVHYPQRWTSVSTNTIRHRRESPLLPRADPSGWSQSDGSRLLPVEERVLSQSHEVDLTAAPGLHRGEEDLRRDRESQGLWEAGDQDERLTGMRRSRTVGCSWMKKSFSNHHFHYHNLNESFFYVNTFTKH